jgi:hypothetical protein
MKIKLIIPFMALALPAFAGSPAPQVQMTTTSPEPCLWSWFVGGSVGYLVETEEVMYTGHVGVTTPWCPGGWKISIFAEGAYTEVDDGYRDDGFFSRPDRPFGFNLGSGPLSVDVETEIVPVTLNVKFEHAIVDKLSFYIGGGLGVAFVDIDADAWTPFGGYSASENDEVFSAQVFSGLSYSFTPAFEMYGGARWIYLDDIKIDGYKTEVGDDWLFELGARFKF